MNLCGTIILFALATLLGFGQNPDTKTSRKEPPSDRVRSGLRGPVKICVQESTYPAVTTSNGTQFPEWKLQIESEYDQEGHLVSTRNRNSDGSVWMVRNTYASGKLLKTTRGKEGERRRLLPILPAPALRLKLPIPSGERSATSEIAGYEPPASEQETCW